MSRRLALCLAVSLALAACGAPATVEDRPPAASSSRVDEVRDLRAALAAPAVALGRAGQQVSTAVEALRTEPGADHTARLAAVAAARSDALAALDRSLDEAGDVRVDGGGPDALAASAAWEDALVAAGILASSADDELELIGRLATVDGELEQIIAVWDEPGSRRQQLDAFAAAATRADELAVELAVEFRATDGDASCLGDVQRRVDAATFVAAATRELRRYVAGHQGNAFDERRAELAQDPYGLAAPVTQVDAPSCWRDDSATARSAAELAVALSELERALNPADLATPEAG